MSVARLLEGKRIVVCAGPGGVGKTTTAAAIALGMAEQGLKVAVLTIDPAKRLANSLGLAELGNEETRVPVEIDGDGELWALMLDAKRTWDEVIERHASDERTRDAVLNNRIYQELSNAVAGSTEYMAMEKLYELYQEDRYDLLVLDTPPTRNALDFLDAPERLSRFIDSRSLQFFLKPGRLGLKVFGRGSGIIFSVLKRVTGVDLLQDLSVFFRALGGLVDGFRERAAGVKALLGDPGTLFLIITSPEREPIEEAIFFHGKLREAHMPFGGLIVNRVQPAEGLDGDPGRVEKALEDMVGEPLAGKVAQAYAEAQVLARRDRAGIDHLRAEVGGPEPIVVPQIDGDVHDVEGLAAIRGYLFA